MNERVTSSIAKLEAFMRDRDDALNIPRAAGELVYALLRASGATRGLEIGTSYGYSALWAGAALDANGGELITIDMQKHKHDAARRHFIEAGLDHVIRCVTGVALDVLDGLPGPFDYVLSDADKPNCIPYVEKIASRLRPRAVVLTDNTESHQLELAPFCAWIRNRSDFASAHLPVGNGMELAVYEGVGSLC